MTDMASRLDKVIDDAIAAGRIVGTVTMVARNGELVYARATGHADREAGRRMERDAIFRLASLSKPIVAAAALVLVDHGTLDLDRPATDWLPDFRPRLMDGFTPDITIRQLLTHTAGLGYATAEPDDPYRDARVSDGLEQPGLGMEEELRRIVSAPLYFAPGTGWRYSVAIDVLGAIIAEAQRKSLGEVIAERVTVPLAMVDTAFSVTDRNRLAVAYADAESGPVRMGDPHTLTIDPGKGLTFCPSRIFDPRSFQSGGTGMAGTAPDFLRLLETIRTGGAPILKAETVDAALANQVGALREDEAPGAGFGYLSAVFTDPDKAEAPYSVGTARWGGLYGHSWFIDRAADLSVVCLSNTAAEGCLGRYPGDIASAVYG
ncbi:MAG: beta-lactamase family protein [Hyphomicrobiales bacterium]|nr:beta-lactamase family protein [Hyphomicrobiales bacterium]